MVKTEEVAFFLCWIVIHLILLMLEVYFGVPIEIINSVMWASAMGSFTLFMLVMTGMMGYAAFVGFRNRHQAVLPESMV